jgi:hypothetical protein
VEVQEASDKFELSFVKDIVPIFTRAGCDLLHIRTGEDYVKVLQKFFIGRNR